MAVFRRGFLGGIHPVEFGISKEATKGLPIRDAKPPVRVAIALHQHSGQPCIPVVQAGDIVDLGQVIGAAEGLISAPVHASVSGQVLKLEQCVLCSGIRTQAVIIGNDFEDRWHPGCKPRDSAESLNAEQLLQIVREAGIVGLGGGAFPTAVKLTPSPTKPVDTVLLNGAECEPYLTCDHRLMLENADEVADGFLLAQKMLGARDAVAGIKDSMQDAAEVMRKALGSKATVKTLPARYPQGGEKQLIYTLTDRVVPLNGLTADIGVVVLNVGTAAAISRAVRQGKPLTDRVVTVTGRVAQPANLRVRIGIAVADLIEECGGLAEGVEKVVLGGPMTGTALHRLDHPVVKGVNGILALGNDSVAPPELACMHCGRCVRVCPMRLLPNQIDAASRHSRWDLAAEHHATACLECGACAYACPSKRWLTQSCRTAKAAIKAQPAAENKQE